MDIQTMIWAILSGAVSGGIAAGVGFLKANWKWDDKFDGQKMILVVLIGLIIGGLTSNTIGWTYMQAEQWVATSGMALLLDALAKAIWAKVNGTKGVVAPASPPPSG